MKLTRIEARSTKSWSGGKTTELYISPVDSDYGLKNFDFRLSTATVEIDESIFTPLPGFYRALMVLEGEMELIHENQHQIKLKPLDVDRFEGAWQTNSIGKCVDFNLMTRGNIKADLFGKSLDVMEMDSIKLDSHQQAFIYLHKGVLEVSSADISLKMQPHDLVKFEVLEAKLIKLNASEKAVIAIVVLEN